MTVRNGGREIFQDCVVVGDYWLESNYGPTTTSRTNAIFCGDIAAVLPIRSNITRKKKIKNRK